VRLPIVEPSVKHRIAPGKEFRISRKRERYTVAVVEFLRHLYSLKTILGGVIAHADRVGTIVGKAIEMEVFGQRMDEEV